MDESPIKNTCISIRKTVSRIDSDIKNNIIHKIFLSGCFIDIIELKILICKLIIDKTDFQTAHTFFNKISPMDHTMTNIVNDEIMLRFYASLYGFVNENDMQILLSYVNLYNPQCIAPGDRPLSPYTCFQIVKITEFLIDFPGTLAKDYVGVVDQLWLDSKY